MSPQWLIVCILIITLVLALQKSATKGIQSWKKESAEIAAAAAAAANAPPGGGGAVAPADPIKIKLADFKACGQLVRGHRRSCGLIFGCWATFMILNMFKAPQCSALYWTQLVGMLMICGAFTSAGAATIRHQVTDAQKPLAVSSVFRDRRISRGVPRDRGRHHYGPVVVGAGHDPGSQPGDDSCLRILVLLARDDPVCVAREDHAAVRHLVHNLGDPLHLHWADRVGLHSPAMEALVAYCPIHRRNHLG